MPVLLLLLAFLAAFEDAFAVSIRRPPAETLAPVLRSVRVRKVRLVLVFDRMALVHVDVLDLLLLLFNHEYIFAGVHCFLVALFLTAVVGNVLLLSLSRQGNFRLGRLVHELLGENGGLKLGRLELIPEDFARELAAEGELLAEARLQLGLGVESRDGVAALVLSDESFNYEIAQSLLALFLVLKLEVVEEVFKLGSSEGHDFLAVERLHGAGAADQLDEEHAEREDVSAKLINRGHLQPVEH